MVAAVANSAVNPRDDVTSAMRRPTVFQHSPAPAGLPNCPGPSALSLPWSPHPQVGGPEPDCQRTDTENTVEFRDAMSSRQ